MYVSSPAANTQFVEPGHGEHFHIVPLCPFDHVIYRSLSMYCPFCTSFSLIVPAASERFAEAGSGGSYHPVIHLVFWHSYLV